MSATALGTFTAAAALLVGLSGAQAQAPAPSAPLAGAGSFPGSFIVPGTNTSLHVGGIIQLDTTYDFDSSGAVSAGAYQNLYPGGVALKSVSATIGFAPVVAQTSAQVQGGTMRINPNATHPFFETRTPTDYGELKTFWEIDFAGTYSASGGAAGGGPTGNDYGASGIGITGQGNYGTPRLKQAYGTLGPWLLGMTNSNFADLDALPDTVDGGVEAGGFMGAGLWKNPQIRYTYLLPNGISVAASLEEVDSSGIFAGTGGATQAVTFAAATSSTLPPIVTDTIQTTYNNVGTGQFEFNNTNAPGMSMRIPGITAKIRIDQPWGHDQFAVAIQQSHIQNFGASTELGNASSLTSGSTIALPSPVGLGTIPLGGHISKWGYHMVESGHFNTIGKDKVSWMLAYGQGASAYNWALFQAGTQFEEGVVCGVTGAGGGPPAVGVNSIVGAPGNVAVPFGYKCSQPRTMGANLGYSHWWTDTWRSGIGLGYDHESRPGVAGAWANSNLSILEKAHLSGSVNIQWTPVPATQFALEFEEYRRYVWSGAEGTAQRVDFQTLFKF
jgi:hypothetical protein